MSLRVLVVDDNQDAAEVLAYVLQDCGHDVRIAHDARQALSEAITFQPNVAWLDIGMPGMNGIDLGIALKNRFPNCVLIALSGYGDDAAKQASTAAGFALHLLKPVDVARVRTVMADLG